jgi:hypothetical protein
MGLGLLYSIVLGCIGLRWSGCTSNGFQQVFMPLDLAEGGGGEGGGGEGGGGEGEDRQQASLHVPESFLFLVRHNFVQLL